jgi:hypothetical protein
LQCETLQVLRRSYQREREQRLARQQPSVEIQDEVPVDALGATNKPADKASPAHGAQEPRDDTPQEDGLSEVDGEDPDT